MQSRTVPRGGIKPPTAAALLSPSSTAAPRRRSRTRRCPSRRSGAPRFRDPKSAPRSDGRREPRPGPRPQCGIGRGARAGAGRRDGSGRLLKMRSRPSRCRDQRLHQLGTRQPFLSQDITRGERPRGHSSPTLVPPPKALSLRPTRPHGWAFPCPRHGTKEGRSAWRCSVEISPPESARRRVEPLLSNNSRIARGPRRAQRVRSACMRRPG